MDFFSIHKLLVLALGCGDHLMERHYEISV